jgi:hypothetical protein
MRNRITAAEARSGYQIWVRFADGTEGEVDLSHLVGEGVFSAWLDPTVFTAVEVDPQSGTVVWPNGADVAPDTLYHAITRVRP